MDARHTRQGTAVLLFAAAILTSWARPAAARVPTTVPVPVPVRILGGPTPDVGTDGGGPPTTVASVASTPTPGAPASATPPSGRGPTAPGPAPARKPTVKPTAPGPAPGTAVAVEPTVETEPAVPPPTEDGVAPTARRLGFPLALAALVSAFVAVQGRLDRRDPKLAVAPVSVHDDLLPFA